MLSAFTISFRLAMVSGWSESYSRLLIAYANHVLRNISPCLFQHYSSSVPYTLTHSLAVGIICYFTEMWFSGNSAERGQLGVAPSQHLSNGLEEIHLQIKQTRWKELKNNAHKHTMASWKWIILPWVANKTACLCTDLYLRHVALQQPNCPIGFGFNHIVLMFFDLWSTELGKAFGFRIFCSKKEKSDI